MYKRSAVLAREYAHAYYVTHRDKVLARTKAYQRDHAVDLAIGRRATYKGRKALDAVEVETLFDGVLPFLMKRGHRYLTKKE